MRRLASFLSFSGRADRQDLLAASLILGAAEVAKLVLPLPRLFAWALTAFVLWAGSAAMVKRLHDTGRSGWWLPGGLAFCLGWMVVAVIGCFAAFGLDALRPGNALYPVSLGLAFLPMLGAMLWLHAQPGDPVPNRFGPPRPARATATGGVRAAA
jgi:uncharacterized membrane protein YhaH (DUF805 family)